LEGHAGEVDICAWTPDGRYILSLDNFHDELKVWDFKTGEEVESFNKDASWGDPSFTLRDGRRVSYAWASQQLYDRDSREILMTPRWHCLWPQDCAVSSDGCLSVYVSPDKKLWGRQNHRQGPQVFGFFGREHRERRLHRHILPERQSRLPRLESKRDASRLVRGRTIRSSQDRESRSATRR